MSKYLQFLSGGGEMGTLTRAFNWESSPIGSIDRWSQSLRTTLSILLNSKFPMFLFWGPHHICFYNDAYRPSLGNEGKHPSILGMKGEEAWPEIWDIIKPLIDQVLAGGEATWSEDQLIPIYRNGKMEDVYWTFSYSPVKDESDLPAGVFVTCTETTDKVHNLKKLAEINNQLNFAIEATQLGTWDFNPLTNEFIVNHYFKEWFNLPIGEEIDISTGLNLIAKNDRRRISQSIQRALKYKSGGFYDVEYSIINPMTKQERIVRAKGKVWFGEAKKAYRFNGTLQDITREAIARRNINESEQRFRNLILQAPVSITTFQGPSFIIDTNNKTALGIWGKSYEEVINKPLFEVSPELEDGLKTILDDVYTTGEPFIANEIPIQIKRKGKPDTAYFNSVYQPLRDLDNKIYGIILLGTEVTEAVNARKQIEANEKRFSNILSQSLMAIGILKGTEMTVAFANEPLLKILGKGKDVIGKPILEVIPEIKDQPFSKLLQDVYTTGVAFAAEEMKGNMLRNEKLEECYFNLVYQPYRDVDDNITGVTVLATEITDYVLAKKQIEKSEEKYRGLFDAIDQGLSIIEMIFDETNKPIDYRFIENNSVFSEQTGLPDITNKTAREAIPALDDFWFETFGKVALTGKSIRFTQKSDALNRWFDVNAFRLGNQGSNKVAVLFTNITDRKKAEFDLMASEELFRVLTHNSPDIITRLDKDGRYLYASPSIKKLTGKNAEEFIGRKYREAGLAEHICQLFDTYIPLVLQEKKSHTIEFTAMSGLEVYSRLVPEFNEKGEAVSVMMIHADITERKQAEEKIKESEAKFRTLSETIPTMVWTAAPDGKKNFFNQYFLNYTGLSFEELKNDGMLKIIFPDDLKKDSQQWQHALETGEDFKMEKRLRHHDGTFRWHVSHGIAQKDNNGNITGWIGSNTDISEHKIKEQQKDEFISIASHEMKTPLTSAKAYLELILPLLSEENKTAFLYANKANQAVERLHSLVTELLDVSKIQHGQLNYNISTFDFIDMIDEAIENIQLTAKNHSLEKIGNCLHQIKGDRDRLQQVLINLLSNAIKFSPNADKVLIKIDELDGKIQVSVQDFGVGMSSQHLYKIFDRYYRVQEHAVFFQGLGIGLHISSNIIQRHNGTMWADSEPGKGSTFYFTVPV